MNLHQVIVGAVSTEKSVASQTKDQHVFFVNPQATKIDIKNAFKEFWGVDVAKVRVLKTPEKTKLVARGKTRTKRAQKVKAYVSFKKGSNFEILKFAGAKKAVKKPAKEAPADKKEVKK